MERSGTFLVTHADENAAVLENVESRQVHALASNPGIEEGMVIEGTLGTDPPLELTWELIAIDEHRSIPVERSAEAPTSQEREIAGEQAIGEITRVPRAGTGELHVLTIDPEHAAAAIDDVREDSETVARAARLGVDRVEIRAAPDEGVLSVRYLP